MCPRFPARELPPPPRDDWLQASGIDVLIYPLCGKYNRFAHAPAIKQMEQVSLARFKSEHVSSPIVKHIEQVSLLIINQTKASSRIVRKIWNVSSLTHYMAYRISVLPVKKYIELVTSPIIQQTCQVSIPVTKQIQLVSCK